MYVLYIILAVLNVTMWKNIHVVTHNWDWAIRKEWNKNVTCSFSTQREAIGFGRSLAKDSQSELFIHWKNWQIIERNTYGKDPYPPRG